MIPVKGVRLFTVGVLLWSRGGVIYTRGLSLILEPFGLTNTPPWLGQLCIHKRSSNALPSPADQTPKPMAITPATLESIA